MSIQEAELERFRAALQEIATGEIVGEPRNYRDTLAIVRRVALDALRNTNLHASADAPASADANTELNHGEKQ